MRVLRSKRKELPGGTLGGENKQKRIKRERKPFNKEVEMGSGASPLKEDRGGDYPGSSQRKGRGERP